MMSLHRKWSNRVQMPIGSRWAPSGSVAECMSWNTSGSSDRYGEKYGILKAAPEVTFDPSLEITETTRINGTLEARVVTPCPRLHTPKPPSRNAWSSYKTNGDQFTVDTLATGSYSPLPPDVIRDTLIETQRPGSKYGMYETSDTFDTYHNASDTFRNQNQQTYDPEKELMIRDFLTRKEIESYEREIENEKRKLKEDTQRTYQDHLRTMSLNNNRLNEVAASNAVKAHISKTVPPCTPMDTYYTGRLSAKPPVPRAPKYGQSQYSSSAHQRKFTPQRTSRPTSAVHYGQDGTRNLDEMLKTKRVVFQSPRPGSALTGRGDRGICSQKGEHFFQWRDAVTPALKQTQYGEDQLWKMNRFTKSAHPKISTRWDQDSRIGSAYRKEAEKGQVNVNVNCGEGENVDVELSVSHSPSKIF